MAKKRDKTDRLLGSLRSKPQIRAPIATDTFIPNHSGISHHREFINNTFWQRNGTVLSPKTSGDDITTTGTFTGINITSGDNPGHTHSDIPGGLWTDQGNYIIPPSSHNICAPNCQMIAGGSSYCGCIGDTGAGAGRFSDGTREVVLADGTHSGLFCGSYYSACLVHTNAAACFSGASVCVQLVCGSCALITCGADTCLDCCLTVCCCACICCDTCVCCCLCVGDCINVGSNGWGGTFCCNGYSGVTTTFTNGDGATVTVSGGIITSVGW